MASVITISAHNEPSPVPKELEARLNAGISPTKSPEELQNEFNKHSTRAALLRQAHLDSIKDRAAREIERVADAAARRRRVAASQVEKLQRRIDTTDLKVQ